LFITDHCSLITDEKTTMNWVKRGQIFAAHGQRQWMTYYAANPVAEQLEGNLFRIYFASRDDRNRSHIGYLDAEINDTVRVLDLAEEPVVAPGPVGSFDDSGTTTGCLCSQGSKRFLYYMGWNLGVTVPWRNSIGLAVKAASHEPFVKVSRAPIVDRSDDDPFSLSYPWVLQDGDRWKMWYGSNLSWGQDQKDMGHVIKYAESEDGIFWERRGIIAIDLQLPEEYALCRPCVLKQGELYRMWYCHRGQAYRIGYAESDDGIRWQRRPDLIGIDVSPSGWDSEMLAYPFVFMHGGRHHLLYCGNHYGKTGFGLAVEADGA
jgi:hypothetical protein